MQDVQIQVQQSINTYIVVKTGIGITTIVITAVILWSFNIDLWFTLALLTFLFNYVPYIGIMIATIPPIILGIIVVPSAFFLFLMTVLLLVNQQGWGNIIETKWAGWALDLSPVLLLLFMAFSFWVWGIIGMILAIPCTVIIKIVLKISS